MSQSVRDQQAETAVKSAIRGLFAAAAIEEIAVLPGENHNGDPALSVIVRLKAGQPRTSGARLLDALTAAVTALREIDDERFPYMTFLAPEDEQAEDTRPAA